MGERKIQPFPPSHVSELRIPEQLSLSFFPSVRLGGKKGGEQTHNRAAGGGSSRDRVFKIVVASLLFYPNQSTTVKVTLLIKSTMKSSLGCM